MADPDENPIQDLLFQLLGPSGLDLLIQADASGDAARDSITKLFIDGTLADIETYSNLDTATSIDEAEIWWKFKIGQNLLDTGADIGFDIGVPGLGLETEGEIEQPRARLVSIDSLRS